MLSVALIGAMFFVPFLQLIPVAVADDLSPTYQVVLWDTKYFQGTGGEWFWGTAFFYQATNEQNPSYDWYFVGMKFHRQNPIGTIDSWRAWMETQNYAYVPNYQVDAQPWYKDPLSGPLDLTVGTGGASVTAHLETDGYDRGSWSTSDTATEFIWDHSFTYADSDHWSTKSGAMVAKNAEYSGNSDIGGAAGVGYVWDGWDWGCWCYLYRQRGSEWPDGWNIVYGDATPGS